VIESFYYAYRVTKDEKYRDWAWEAWEAINRTARLAHGFSYFHDVDSLHGKMGDNQESFFFSETLKYLFLIFSDDAEWQFNSKGGSAWIFNTEGHPLKVRD
jgi:mannosyl-oligosaccharide alpha-1,2-mannosidase